VSSKSSIAIEYRLELKHDLQEEAEVAAKLRDHHKFSNVIIVIPDSLGIHSVTMSNGIKIIALGQLTAAQLDQN
jgi:hypothetical protein